MNDEADDQHVQGATRVAITMSLARLEAELANVRDLLSNRLTEHDRRIVDLEAAQRRQGERMGELETAAARHEAQAKERDLVRPVAPPVSPWTVVAVLVAGLAVIVQIVLQAIRF